MITCSGHSEAHGNKHFHTDYFPRKNRHLFLLVEFWDEHPALDSVFHAILERVIAFETGLDPDTIVEQLQDFFQKLNWQVFSLLRQMENALLPEKLNESGASLLFALTVDNEIFVVQFGRILCCYLNNYGVEEPRPLDESQLVGSPWRNFGVKSKADMNLLGHKGEDIAVKVHRLRLDRGEAFLALSSAPAQRLLESGVSRTGLPYYLRIQGKQEGFSYVLLEGDKPASTTRRRFWAKRRFYLSALMIIVLMGTSFWYFHRGKNVIADTAAQSEEKVREIVTNPEIYTEPASKVEMVVDWKISLPSDSVRAIVYDQEMVYVGLASEVIAINRTRHTVVWRTLAKTGSLSALDSNRLLIREDTGRLLCLKRNIGTVLWERRGTLAGSYPQNPEPVQISRFDDRRLNNSYVLLRENVELVAVNFMTARELDKLRFSAPISLITPFEPAEKQIFVTAGRTLYAIGFRIEP